MKLSTEERLFRYFEAEELEKLRSAVASRVEAVKLYALNYSRNTWGGVFAYRLDTRSSYSPTRSGGTTRQRHPLGLFPTLREAKSGAERRRVRGSCFRIEELPGFTFVTSSNDVGVLADTANRSGVLTVRVPNVGNQKLVLYDVGQLATTSVHAFSCPCPVGELDVFDSATTLDSFVSSSNGGQYYLTWKRDADRRTDIETLILNKRDSLRSLISG
jgi:hypothetical protein